MYSVADLSKIFETTKKTIYTKLQAPEIKDFVYQSEKGIRIKQEGFNILQVLLSKSKVVFTKDEVKSEVKDEVKSNDYKDEVVNILKEQVDELRKEKVELQKKYDAIVGVFLEHQKQQLLLESEKSRPFWKRLFFKN